jgi:osmotically-inducible protein OsmY
MTERWLDNMKRFLMYAGKVYIPVITVVLLLGLQTVYAASGNNDVKAKVEKAITSRYDPTSVQVNVADNGVVTLEGDVNSLYDKYRIYEIASRVHGVKDIANNITVNTDMLPGKVIEANIRDLINNSTEIKEPQKINIDVNNSVVKLSGDVTFFREKVAAMTLTSQVDGVTDIKDDIKVTPIGQAVDDNDIKDYLNSIVLNEFPLVNRKDIDIKVNNGFVTIDGSVPNLWTKDNIEKEFNSVGGVIRVINNLEVNPDINS